jgi:hydroxymethylpyrimidine pyrophosphatase-like HAD family hydrolase
MDEQLKDFLRSSRFALSGAVLTDLDGTAVHEFQGQVVIPEAVMLGLKRLNNLSRQVIINSLRFPLNVIRTFGREWYSITNAPLPLVALNGSLTGHLVETGTGEISFEESEAFPLSHSEIEEVLVGVDGLIRGDIRDLVLFYYPREWALGEIIWTPTPAMADDLRAKYSSASMVIASDIDELRYSLHERDVCMILLLIEVESDRLMAYQHSKRSNFITRKGVDKLSGAQAIATKLGIDLSSSVGAGDTPMDSFLKGVGLAVHVGPVQLEFHGLLHTIKVADSLEFGKFLFRLAEWHQGALP